MNGVGITFDGMSLTLLTTEPMTKIERYSPTLLATFLGCRQAAAWDLRRHRGEDENSLARFDHHGALILRLDDEHEARVLAHLQATSEVAVIDDATLTANTDSGGDDAFDTTRRAMDAGVPWIHGAALRHERWFGLPDFLRRVERPCERWAWSYEPWDARLARQAQPKHVLQICVYGELLDELQGVAPQSMGLMLGTGASGGEDEGTAYVAVEFAFDDFRYYTQRVVERLSVFVGALPDDFEGEPCLACSQCHWARRCDELWDRLDHLSRVADISREQRRRLTEANVTTLGGLADLTDLSAEDWPPVRLRMGTLKRLVEQAALQRRTMHATARVGSDASDGMPIPPEWALLPWRAGFGLDRLPPPDVADLFFYSEEDPLEPGGLEYLWGVVAREAVEGPFGRGEVFSGRSAYRYRAFWGRDRHEEKLSFDALVDALVAHFERYRNAHLYHYAPHEETAMKRLAAIHGTREREVDSLVRSGRLVDLYRVVREGVRIGAPSYSIKNLEPLYMDERVADIVDGGQNVVMYHAWRATRNPETLVDIETYSRSDCVSTMLLHDWLLERVSELGRPPEPSSSNFTEDAPNDRENDAERDRREARRKEIESERAAIEAEVRRLERELVGGDEVLPGGLVGASDPAPASDVADGRERNARRLAADLLRYHEREASPEWWAYFERKDATPEALVDDADCLGDCTMDLSHWGEPDGRSFTYRFRFPPQGTKLTRGAMALFQSGASAGQIVELDTRAGTLVLRRGPVLGEPPERLALMPLGPLDTSPISGAVRRVVRDYVEGGGTYHHITTLLSGMPPELGGQELGAPIVPLGLTEPAALLNATVDAVRRLNHSWLCIQGPPGGGKTFTLARIIHALVEDGRRVGVTSASHAAIDNVLQGVERYRAERVGHDGDRAIIGYKKISGNERYESPLGEEAMIESCTGRRTKAGRDWDPEADVFGGSAWWFSAEDGPKVDVLIVDEANQVSLGHFVGMASAARNVVLVGDPMQLPQSTKGFHPRASGLSCLEYAIGEHAVVPPDRGIFLGTTWRMHPDLTHFISEAIYGGRLAAEANCGNQRLLLPADRTVHAALKPAGLGFVELQHVGCSQRSASEAEETVQIYTDLLAASVIDRNGVKRAMKAHDIIVIAPYDMQVNLLRELLAPHAGQGGPRVGTVEKFQGQEAEAVIVSMTTSDAESMPRNAPFFQSRNRLNMAISRARCLAVVMASSGLLDLNVRTLEEMRLANLLCRARKEADRHV